MFGLKPARLAPGARIGVVCPAYWIEPERLERAQARARDTASHEELTVGVLFITPRWVPSGPAIDRFEAANTFIGASRAIRCGGCAFSFPDAHEIDRYRYGNTEHPGALLFVEAVSSAANVST